MTDRGPAYPRAVALRTPAENARATLDVVDAPVAELRPWPRNPRRIRPERLEQLKAMLVAAPAMLRARPLIALMDGTVIAGNQRLVAATDLGWDSIPTVFVDLDERTAIEWALRDNNPVGEPDEDLTAELLAELGAGGADALLTGFAPDETARLLARLNRRDADPDAVPPVLEAAVSVPGTVYELGTHRVMCGDSTTEAHTRALVGTGGQAQALWTDPPYGVALYAKFKGAEDARKRKKRTDGKTIPNDDIAPRPLLAAALQVAADVVMAPSSCFYIAAPPGPLNTEFRLAIVDAGWRFHQALVWVKDVFVLGHSDYHYRHEDILYGYSPGPGRAGRGQHEGTRWFGGHSQDSIFEVSRPKRSDDHPTMKPVELIEQQLANSTRAGDIIYDPFAGSGSTLIAAEVLGRPCLAMEIDPRYCDVIRQRYADYVGDQQWAP